MLRWRREFSQEKGNTDHDAEKDGKREGGFLAPGHPGSTIEFGRAMSTVESLAVNALTMNLQ